MLFSGLKGSDSGIEVECCSEGDDEGEPHGGGFGMVVWQRGVVWRDSGFDQGLTLGKY